MGQYLNIRCIIRSKMIDIKKDPIRIHIIGSIPYARGYVSNTP
jgi:hypothetical protein